SPWTPRATSTSPTETTTGSARSFHESCARERAAPDRFEPGTARFQSFERLAAPRGRRQRRFGLLRRARRGGPDRVCEAAPSTPDAERRRGGEDGKPQPGGGSDRGPVVAGGLSGAHRLRGSGRDRG